jgi:serine protease Do
VVLTPPGFHQGQQPPPRARILKARIVGVDKTTDLAVLKIDAEGLPSLAIGDYRKLRQGQLVLAFGSPEGLEDSVTLGVVSSVMRQPNPDKPMVYIQTDAAVNPGNSGGPLVDLDGSLVGINTFILSQSGGSEGMSFAIPSVVVQFVYREILAHGHVLRPKIGVNVQAISPDLAWAWGWRGNGGWSSRTCCPAAQRTRPACVWATFCLRSMARPWPTCRSSRPPCFAARTAIP